MGTPGRGFNSFLQIGREATWATAVAATRRIPVRVLSPKPEQGVVKSQAIDGKITRSAMYAGGQRGGAEIEFELTYEGLALILDGVMGTAAFGSAGGTVVGTNPYTTTYKQRDIVNSYTCELSMGAIPVGKCERLVGGKISELTIKGSAGLNPDDAICICRAKLIGQAYQTNQTPTGALTAVAPLPVLFHQMSTDADGTSDVTADVVLKSWEISIKNALADSRWGGGSALILEPLRNSYIESTIKVVKEFQTRVALDAYLALTQGNPNLVFTSGARSIQFSIPKAYQVTPHVHDMNGPQLLEESFGWEAIDDGGSPSSGLTIVTVNTEPSIS